MKIRIAQRSDAEAITELINSAFAPAEGFFIAGDRIKLQEVIDYLKTGEFLVVEEEGKLAGCVYLEQQGDRTYLGVLSVDPARQQSGLGSQLLSAAEDHCTRRGSRFIDVKVINLRTDLQPYYRKRGYVETGTSPFPEEVETKFPCWFIEMSKSLSQ